MNTDPETAKRELFDAMQEYLQGVLTMEEFKIRANYLLSLINPQMDLFSQDNAL